MRYYNDYDYETIKAIKEGRLTKLIKSHRPNAKVNKYEIGEVHGIKEHGVLLDSLQTKKGTVRNYAYKIDYEGKETNYNWVKPFSLKDDSCRLFIKITGKEVMNYNEVPRELIEAYGLEDFNRWYDQYEANGRACYKSAKNPKVAILSFEVM